MPLLRSYWLAPLRAEPQLPPNQQEVGRIIRDRIISELLFLKIILPLIILPKPDPADAEIDLMKRKYEDA